MTHIDMEKGFWSGLPKPIIALAPMDGVTDAAFRYITDKYGKPHILFTEFTSVEGLSRGAEVLLEAFVHHSTQTPIVAQIFGAEPESFYKTAFILGEMGYDGIDINMGCPDKNVAKHGGGAGLIRTPELAKRIVRETRRGIQDWAAGKTMEEAGLPEQIYEHVNRYKQSHLDQIKPRRELPVSVKTRIGYDKIVTTEWISHLLETEPVNISLHGRTLKQMYTGTADWDEIAKAAELVHRTDTLILGNGDIKSVHEAADRSRTYGTDGALIGRAAFGNPWLFADTQTDWKTRLRTAVEHCRAFVDMTPEQHFLSLRKHMAWYCKGFDRAQEIRIQLMKTNTVEDVARVVEEAIK